MVRILTQFNDTLGLGTDTIPAVDTVLGLDGSDILTTSTLGGSILYGNRDNDSLTSKAAGDTIYGGQENDRLLSLNGGSIFFADLGDDLFEVSGGTGKDTVYGGTSTGNTRDGGDVFNFGNANGGGNLGFGNPGDDFLSGSALGSDTLYGGKGDDTLQVVELGAGGTGGFVPLNTQFGNIGIRTGNIVGGTPVAGSGIGVVITSGTNPPNNLGRNYLSGDLGKDLVIGLGDRDTLLGGEADDTLMLQGTIATTAADNRNTSLKGATGGDIFDLNGVPQNALLDGGNGNDSLVAFGGLRGRNTLLGGGGDDTIKNYGVQSYIEGGAGNDTLIMDDSLFGGAYGRSTLLGGEGGDSINVAGSGGTNLLYGDVGADTLVGGDDSLAGDTLYGGDAANTDMDNDSLTAGFRSLMFGQRGNDTLVGTGANASLYGGKGDDSLLASGNSYLSGDLGSDTLSVTGSGNTLFGGEDNDSLFGLNGSANKLDGGAGNDILRAGAPTDTLIGGEGNDFFVGSSGDDSLGGETNRQGSDTLYGGLGADRLIGRAGFDGFYYASNGEIGDTITAFESGTDQIYLKSTAFGNLALGGNPLANLAGGAVGKTMTPGSDFFSVGANQNYTSLNGTFAGGSNTMPAIVFDSNPDGGGILWWDWNGGGNPNPGGANLSVIAFIESGSVNFNDIMVF